MINQPFIKKTLIAVYFVIVLSTAVLAYIKPQYNWDLIPYTAATISFKEDDPKKLHEQTYRMIEESVPVQTFHDLTTSDNNYRETMYTDYISFNQQLPFYKIKPLYIYLINILNLSGVGIVKATSVISILSYIGICALLYLFTNKLKTHSIGIAVLSLVVLSKPFYLIAKLSSPDALSAFIITLSLFLILNKNLKLLPSILLVLAIFIRTDNIIICNLLFIYFGLLSPIQYRFNKIQSSAFIFIASISYFTINYLANSYGWSVLFTHAFIQNIDRPAEYISHLTIFDYLKTLITNGSSLFLSTDIFWFIIFGLIGLMISSNSGFGSVYNHLIKIVMLTMIVYFLLFPSFEVDRYFISEYIIIIFCAVNILISKDAHNIGKESLRLTAEAKG